MNYEILSIATSEKIGRYNKTIKYIKQELNDLNKLKTKTSNAIIQAKIKRDIAIYNNLLKMLEVKNEIKQSREHC